MSPVSNWVLLILVSLATSLPARACSYEGQFNNPFTESFPGSLDVAIATQQAIEDGLTPAPSLQGQQGLRQASWWLKLLAKQWKSELGSETFVYLVDSHLWSEYKADYGMTVHTQAANTDQKVLLISEAALYHLVAKELSFTRAQQLGIAQFSI